MKSKQISPEDLFIGTYFHSPLCRLVGMIVLNGNHRFWPEKEGQFAETNFLLIIHPHKSIFQLIVIPS